MRPAPSYLVEVTGEGTIIIRLQVAEKDTCSSAVYQLLYFVGKEVVPFESRSSSPRPFSSCVHSSCFKADSDPQKNEPRIT